MNSSLLSSLGPVLAAPWRQRRNTGSLWGVGIVAFMALLGPVALFVWSLFVQFGHDQGTLDSIPNARLAAELRHAALNSGMFAPAVLVLAWWALIVSNLLDQNRPVFARLVPGHPARLRAALVVAWGCSVGVVTLLVGGRFGQPLLCVAAAAPLLTLLAVSVRWPLVWMLGVIAPLVVPQALAWPGLDAFLAGARAQWLAQPVAITLTLVAACLVVLMALIQAGGRHHVASDEARRHRVKRFQMRAQGMQPMGAATGKRNVLDLFMSRPYFAWWDHELARPGRPVFGRLMLGLGPRQHWTAVPTSIAGLALIIVAGFGAIELVGLAYLPARGFAVQILASTSVGMMPGLLAPVMQVQARLHQTRREQALLVLLPGVPRGAVLSRRLAWQLTGQFVLTLGIAFAVVALLQRLAVAIAPDALSPQLASLGLWFAVGAVPLLAFQWRGWARVGAPSSLNALVPLLVMALVMAAFAAGTKLGLFGETPAIATVVAATAAWCALRGRRMAREPASLPIGRLA